MYVAVITIGLSLALGASLLILSFVNYEMSFEKCHENADRIYRIGGSWTNGDYTLFLATTMYPLGPSLKDALPEVEEQARLYRMDNVTAETVGNLTYKEPKFLLADPAVFSVFSIPLIYGDPQSVLSRPYSVVISEQISRNLFAGTNPIGQTITVNDSVTFTVTGVMRDLPQSTRIHTDFLASYSTLDRIGENLNEWDNTGSFNAYTYLLLAKGTDPKAVDTKLPEILTAHLGEDASKFDLHLQLLKDLYFHSKLSDELGPSGSLNNVYLFAGIAFLLILMACFNYINLSVSRAYHRNREIMVRSTVGASRKQLFAQFLSESILLASFSMILGLVFYEFAIPYLEAYVGKSLDVGLSGNVFVWLAAPILVLVVGVMAGSYPAAVLLRLRRKGGLSSGMPAGLGKSKLRRSLVVFQAFLAIGLIGFTVGVQRQLNFINSYDTGFNPDNVRLFEFDQDATPDQMDRLKREFKKAGLTDATLVLNAPGESFFQGTLIHPEADEKRDPILLSTFTGDIDYGSTFGLRLESGRWLSDESVADMPGAVLINETAAEILGLEYPVGSELSSSRGPLKVVGVVKDFLTLSLHYEIMPAVITNGATSGRLLAVRLPEDGQPATMKRLRDIWATVFPNTAFECRPLREVMSDSYSDERKLISLFSVSSGLSIVIAGLGMLGLASFTVEKRTREIGIRKIIGASVTSITRLLAGEYVVLVIVAGVIAWPFANYAITRWLENFAYKIEYGLPTYTLVVAAVLVLSFCTVGVQIIRAALANPVDALRHE